MTNTNKIYLFAAILMIAAFFLTKEIMSGIKSSDFNLTVIFLAVIVAVVSVFLIVKWGKIENNK